MRFGADVRAEAHSGRAPPSPARAAHSTTLAVPTTAGAPGKPRAPTMLVGRKLHCDQPGRAATEQSTLRSAAGGYAAITQTSARDQKVLRGAAVNNPRHKPRTCTTYNCAQRRPPLHLLQARYRARYRDTALPVFSRTNEQSSTTSTWWSNAAVHSPLLVRRGSGKSTLLNAIGLLDTPTRRNLQPLRQKHGRTQRQRTRRNAPDHLGFSSNPQTCCWTKPAATPPWAGLLFEACLASTAARTRKT